MTVVGRSKQDGGDQELAPGDFTRQADIGETFFEAGPGLSEMTLLELLVRLRELLDTEGVAEVRDDVFDVDIELEVVGEGPRNAFGNERLLHLASMVSPVDSAPRRGSRPARCPPGYQAAGAFPGYHTK